MSAITHIQPLLSICIPCYGRSEQVRMTLNSIFKDNSDVPLSDFEVVISDNDPKQEVLDVVKDFNYENISYNNPSCEGFMNSFQVLTYANGTLLKLHNSQEVWRKGSLRMVIDDIRDARKDRGLIFYTSGQLLNGRKIEYESYDSFMSTLSYFSSWSNGFCIWKEDFEMVQKDVEFNPLFPHTSLLLTQTYKTRYIINDYPIFHTQFVKKRGGHNKFHAFAYEFPSLIENSCKKGDISILTRDKIFNAIKTKYLPLLFFNVKVAKRETYTSDGFQNDLKSFFPRGTYNYIVMTSVLSPIRALWTRIMISLLRLNK